jgi:hypothetical protein
MVSDAGARNLQAEQFAARNVLQPPPEAEMLAALTRAEFE